MFHLYPFSLYPLFPQWEKSSEEYTAAQALLATFVMYIYFQKKKISKISNNNNKRQKIPPLKLTYQIWKKEKMKSRKKYMFGLFFHFVKEKDRNYQGEPNTKVNKL